MYQQKLPWDIFLPVTYPNVIDGYAISNTGTVVDTETQSIVPDFLHHDFLFVSLITTNHKLEEFAIHRLVAWEFCPELRTIDNSVGHVDGNKLNNYYKNLRWFISDSKLRKISQSPFLSNAIEHIRNLDNWEPKFYRNNPDDFLDFIQRKHPKVKVTMKLIKDVLGH